MKKTECLYYADQYMTDFEATVISCERLKDDLFDIVLDRTCFFPEQGGQICDRGIIDDTEVTDVQIKNEIIHHFCHRSFEKGETVKGHIDFSCRFDLMQNHTGEHLFSGIVHKICGYDNVGFHLNDHLCTVDYDGDLRSDDIRKLEILANKAIYENIPVQVSYPSEEELDTLSFRSKKEIENQIRIVTIGEVDCCACCAPHVSSTGQIGIIKVTDRKKHKNGVRLTLLCGSRALNDYQRAHDIVKEAGEFFSTSPENIMDRIKSQQSQLSELKHQINGLLTENLISRLKEEKLVFTDDADQQVAINAVDHYIEEDTVYGIFAGNDDTGYQVVMNNGPLARSCSLNFKGGVRGKMFFGKAMTTRAEIESFFQKKC